MQTGLGMADRGNAPSEEHGPEQPQDLTRTTNDIHKAQSQSFVGDFAAQRRRMDYSYHVNYTPARQVWQDEAIQSVVSNGSPAQERPWLVYTCGPMGVGKGYVWSWLSSSCGLPVEHFVRVDPDALKAAMPEWPHFVAANRATAGTRCHRESGYMAEIAQAAAMERRLNVCVDGSLRDWQHYAGELRRLRQAFPIYRIAILYVHADEATIRARVLERSVRTGRDVPEALLLESLQAAERSVEKLSPLCDLVVRVDNSGAEPRARTEGAEVHRMSRTWALEEGAEVHEQTACQPSTARRCWAPGPLQARHSRRRPRRHMGCAARLLRCPIGFF